MKKNNNIREREVICTFKVTYGLQKTLKRN